MVYCCLLSYPNSGFLFLAGWLDQSFWPDGLYTAPTDDALLSDLTAVQTFGRIRVVVLYAHHTGCLRYRI
jgi:hypothetical protein